MADRLILAALLGAMALGPGCTIPPVDGPADPTPPPVVLPKDSFVMVLAEVQLVEGVAQLRTYRNDNERQRLAEAYSDVWARTGVSAARFEAQPRVVVGTACRHEIGLARMWWTS